MVQIPLPLFFLIKNFKSEKFLKNLSLLLNRMITKREKLVNILLLIAMFSAVGGFVYWILGLFNILAVGWMRSILANLITLILGLLIHFKKEKGLKINLK